MQGSAPITSLSDTSSDTDGSEMELNDNIEANDLSKMESFFLTGVLDELKICFNYTHQVIVNDVYVTKFCCNR